MKEKIVKLLKHKGYWHGVVRAVVSPILKCVVKATDNPFDDAAMVMGEQFLDTALKPADSAWLENEVLADAE